MLIRVLVAVLPGGGGDWLAAQLIGGGPWEAGQTLMRDADPESFAKLVKLYNTCGPRPVAFCAAAITLDEAARAAAGNGSSVATMPSEPTGGTAGRR
jgi:hypothetical protein